MQQIISIILHTTMNKVPNHWRYIIFQKIILASYMCTEFVSHDSASKCMNTKLLPKALQCFCWLKLITALSWSCWQEWHNYCHSWNIDCFITDWLIYLLRLRTSPLLCLAHFDTRIQHISFYEVAWAKHTMSFLAWINN